MGRGEEVILCEGVVVWVRVWVRVRVRVRVVVKGGEGRVREGERGRRVYGDALSYTINLEFLFPPVARGVWILFVAVRVEEYLTNKEFPIFLALVAYTVADIYTSEITRRILLFGARFLIFIEIAIALYFVDTRQYGCTGMCLYRTAKFVLVEELVSVLLGTGFLLIYHPIVWLGIGLGAVFFTQQTQKAMPEQLDTVDAVLHSAAAAVSARTFGIPLRITTFEVIVGLASIFAALSLLPTNPVRDLLRSLALFLIILNLTSSGLFPFILIILSDINTQ